MQWENLFDNGTIVSLSSSLWRARVKLKASDLGIAETPEVKKALSLGSHRLAPPKAFREINEALGRARKAIDAYSVNFAMIRGARFVPAKNMLMLMETLRREKDVFDDAVRAFVANYAVMRNEMLPILESALFSAAHTSEAAAMAFRRVEAEFPSFDGIGACFSLDWEIYTITAPKNAEAIDGMRSESDNVKSIVRSMVEELRKEMSDRASELIKLTEKGGKLPKRSVEPTLELLSRLESLNVFGDNQLRSQMQAMRLWVEKNNEDSEKPDVQGLATIRDAVQQNLEQAVADAEANLTGLGRRRFNGAPKTETLELVEPEAVAP